MQADSPAQAHTTGTLTDQLRDTYYSSLGRCIAAWQRKAWIPVEKILESTGLLFRLETFDRCLGVLGGHEQLNDKTKVKLNRIFNLIARVIAAREAQQLERPGVLTVLRAPHLKAWIAAVRRQAQRSSSAVPRLSATAAQGGTQPGGQEEQTAGPQGPAAQGGTRPPAAFAGSGTRGPGAQAPTTRTSTPQKKVLASLASNINGWLDRDKKYKGVVEDHASDRNLARSLQRLNEILQSLGGYSNLEDDQKISLEKIRLIVDAILKVRQIADGTPWNCQIKKIDSQLTFVHDWIRLAGLDPPSSSAPSQPPATEGQERGQHGSPGRQTATSQRPAPQGRIRPPRAFAGSGTHAPHNRHASNGQAINPGLGRPNNPGGRLPPIGDVFTPAELGELQAPYGRPPVVTSNGPSYDWGSRRPGDAAPPALPVPIAGAQGGLPTNLAAMSLPQPSRQSQMQFPSREQMKLPDDASVYPPMLENTPPPPRVRASRSKSPSRKGPPGRDCRSDRWRV